MAQLLIDHSLRRARIVRAAFVVLLLVVASTLTVFARGLQSEPERPLALPSARHAEALTARRARRTSRPKSGQRRPESGPRPESGQLLDAARPAADAKLHVLAFLDPAAPGGLDSLDRNAGALDAVAVTGLLLGDRGAIIDRLDAGALDLTRTRELPTFAVLQNLDEDGARWRGDRALALAHSADDRRRLADGLVRLCGDDLLAGVNLDLEEIEPRAWPAMARVAADLAARIHGARLAISIDVPPGLDPRVLASLAASVDEVIVMAYDESDEEGPPGPIASEGFVDDALAAAQAVTPSRLVVGLGLYGYDWIGGAPADPISFVDALVAAKEARVLPVWDRASGNLRLRFSDEEGAHEVWMLDAASLWNQLGLARARGVTHVALWRLGSEDPGVWEVLAAAEAGVAPDLDRVASDDRVQNLGDGPFLSLALSPEPGRRKVTVEDGRISDERWERAPSPFVVRRAGRAAGKVALSFDDGPDPATTPAILDELLRAHAPAAFFVVGLAAEAAPDLVRRELAEGHEIGNHSYTHPVIDTVSDARLRLELQANSRLVETLIGRRPLLYRPPALADIEPRDAASASAFARAGALGYLVVDADVDPRDFDVPSTKALVDRVLGELGSGGVILLHDGGGDRSKTVEALPRIIDGVRARGLEIVPLGELIGRGRDEVMPPAMARTVTSQAADQAVFRGAAVAVQAGSACLVVGLVLVALRTALVLALALISERRRRARPLPLPPLVPTVVIPAYNEEAGIARTIASVLESDVPVAVLVVDDGSTDRTVEIVEERYGADPRVLLLRQKNAGKAAALRRGFAFTSSEIVVALDGDTLFSRETVRELLRPFADRRVGAVAGTAEVGNVANAITGCQALEYLVQQALERRAWDALAALPVVPGAVGAWRRVAVEGVGGFSSDTLAEDADLSMALCRAGWRVVYAPTARARTEAPETVATLLRQRVRWTFGTFQAMWKHRGALVERGAGAFGRVVLPSMIVFQLVLPLLAPLAVAATVVALACGNPWPAVTATVALVGAELAQVWAACHFARRDGIAAARVLSSFALGRFYYRPMLVGVLARSIGRVLDGIPLGWGKLGRKGSVRAYRADDARPAARSAGAKGSAIDSRA